MRLKPLLPSAFLLIWWFTAVGLYLWVSRIDYLQGLIFPAPMPFTTYLVRLSPLAWLLDLLRAFLGMTLFALSALSLGLLFLPRFLSNDEPLTRGVLAFLLGEVVFSLFFLTTIRLWQLPPWLSAVGLVFPLFFGLSALRCFLRSLPRLALPTDLSNSDRLLFVLTLTMIALTLTLSSARLGYDASVEYFSHSKIMAMTYLPVLLYPKDPFVVSSLHPGILFTVGIQLFGDQSARMLSWINGIAILILLWALGKRLGFSSRARLYALIILTTSTAFVDLLGDGKIELIATAPILAAIYLFIFQPSKNCQQTATYGIITGTFLGFSMISRPYNLFLIPLFVVFFICFKLIYLRTPSCRTWIPSVPFLLYAGLTIFILLVFHLLQNFLWLGSPVAPLVYASKINGDLWQWQFDPEILTFLKFIYPFTITFFNTPQSLGNISPLFVGFLPFLLSRSVRHQLYFSHQVRALLWSVLLTLIVWVVLVFTVVEIRYAWFLWMLIFAIFGKLIEISLDNSKKFVRAFLYPSIGLLLFFLGARTAIIAIYTYSPIDSSGQAHCYDVLSCTFFQPINDIAALGDRILVLNGYRYYMRPDLFACSSRAEEYYNLERLARLNSADFWSETYRQGFRYVIFEQNFAEFHSHFGTIPAPNNAPPWLRVILLAQTQGNAIYSLDAISPPFQPLKHCEQDAQGRWMVMPAR
ncbi:MAG: hypothetical protein WHS87_10035 [Anaerolineales bacterium]